MLQLKNTFGLISMKRYQNFSKVKSSINLLVTFIIRSVDGDYQHRDDKVKYIHAHAGTRVCVCVRACVHDMYTFLQYSGPSIPFRGLLDLCNVFPYCYHMISHLELAVC